MKSIGTVLAKLRTLGLEDNTLISCISDNGDSSPFASGKGVGVELAGKP
jgi:arylsulfatase A-like enzyme